MSCYKAIEEAIYNDINERFFVNRPSFKRTGINRFEITNQLKNRSQRSRGTAQARRVARNTIKRISAEYNGHVGGYVLQDNIYDDPVYMLLRINPDYVKHIYDTQVPGSNKSDEESYTQGTLWSPSNIEQNPNGRINYRLKATEKVLDNLTKIKQWESNKSIDQNTLWKKIQELGISKQQLELLKESNGNTVEEKLISFVTNYNYPVEINTAKEKYIDYIKDVEEFTGYENEYEIEKEVNTQHYSNLTVPGGTNYTENEIATPLITPSIKGHAQFATDNGIGWFRSDEQVIGGKYEKGKIDRVSPDGTLITNITGEPTKTRRILEVQSDLFQKGRDKDILEKTLESALKSNDVHNTLLELPIDDLKQYLSISDFNRMVELRNIAETGEFTSEQEDLFEKDFNDIMSKAVSKFTQTDSKNQFLQLLNKNNNWVTFFIKSIIQDSAKKGYEKVLFPTGDTASKVEGHTTLEEFKKQKEDRIKELEKQKATDFYQETEGKFAGMWLGKDKPYKDKRFAEASFDNEINQLKQELERVEREGFGALKPIYNFYENTVANILKKQGYNPVLITDEYGNTWNEIEITSEQDSSEILLSMSPQEENNILLDVGHNTSDLLSEDEAYNDPIVGQLSNFLDLKKRLLEDYQRRIKNIEKSIEIKLATKTTLPAEAQQIKEDIKNLNKEKRKLVNEIEGVEASNIKGLKQEIYELTTQGNAMSVGYYVERDLERLKKLEESDDLENMEEAMRIINFYDLAGTFERGVRNPFFEEEQIFVVDNGRLTSIYNIPEEDRAIFEKWRARAMAIKNSIEDKREKILEDVVNSNIAVRKTYGEDNKFAFNTLIDKETGRKDISWFDMWLMDTTMSVGPSNGLLPQVALSEISQEVTIQNAKVREISDKIDKLNPSVLSRLKALRHTLVSRGISNLAGLGYKLFLERNKANQLTGNYATKFNSEFHDDWRIQDNKFWENFQEAKTYAIPEVRKRAFKEAFEKRRNWRRKNTIVIQFHKIPEIINSPDGEFSEFSAHFNHQEAAAYKNYLISVLGEKEYNKQVAAQKKSLRKYVSDKQDMLETLMEIQGIDDESQLSEENKIEMSTWIIVNSPFYGINDYYETEFEDGSFSGNFQKYNVFVPRRNKVTMAPTQDNKSIAFTDTTTPLEKNYYNKDFEEIIEQDDTLYEFHNTIIQALQYVKDVTPADLLEKLSPHHLYTLDKTGAEVLLEDFKWSTVLYKIVPAFKVMFDNIRMKYGIAKAGTTSNLPIDLKTGKKEERINDSFLRENKKPIFDKIKIAGVAFTKAFNDGAVTKIAKLKTFTTRNISEFNPQSIRLLATYLGVNISDADIAAGRFSAITDITGEDVNIGRIIRDYATNEVMQQKSFDLPKVLKYYVGLAGVHAARTNVLPKLQVVKNYYENINDVDTNIMDEPLESSDDKENKRRIFKGKRDKAKRQFNNWYERVILGQVGDKHTKAIGSDSKTAFFSKTIYSRADKKNLKNIQRLIQEIDTELGNLPPTDVVSRTILEEQRAELLALTDTLGKTRTATALVNNFLSWVRFIRLGWNLASAITNTLEGFISNMIVASTGEYFPSSQMFYAYGVAKKSFIKNITFGKFEMEDAIRLRTLMDKFQVLKDSKNELQEASVKTLSDRLEPLRAYTLNQRVEYINQGVLLISVLRSTKITGTTANGEVIESTVWDAFEDGGTGRLKEEFRTEENIRNWEDITGEEGLYTKDKINQIIVLAHGNYDELRGMLAKSNTAGKAVMMFKTWLPQQIFWRFGSRQDNIMTGVKGFRGKYLSYGIGSAAVHGGIVGTALLGFTGLGWGVIAGAALGGFGGTKVTRGLGLASTADSISILRETLTTVSVLLKKMVGMPLNSIAGRELISTSGKEFDAWVGKRNFTQQDANALKANMADISIQLLWILMGLLVKKMFWDDEDEKDSLNRTAYNYFTNTFMQLSQQGAMYVNPVEGHNTFIGSIAPLAYVADVWKAVDALDKWIHDEDEIQSGPYTGESRIKRATTKLFVPGNIQGVITTEAPTSVEKTLKTVMGERGKRQFETHRFDKYFKFDAKAERKRLRKKLLEDKKLNPKQVKQEVDRRIPTDAALKKKKMTRKEYEKKLGKETKK